MNERGKHCVVVTGGRDFNDKDYVFQVLDAVHAKYPIVTLVHGDASGADALAGQWARMNHIGCVACPADWRKHGRSAGPKRNREMLMKYEPDFVVAFPGGIGTLNMARQSESAGVKVILASCVMPRTPVIPRSNQDGPTLPSV